jgi:hypothetical protein
LRVHCFFLRTFSFQGLSRDQSCFLCMILFIDNTKNTKISTIKDHESSTHHVRISPRFNMPIEKSEGAKCVRTEFHWSDKKNLKREIRWNHFDHDKLFRHLILLPGLVYKADHTP